ncbi:hypothetical protein BHF71_07475 [Vulcanibacillus modesticaldus]|uniref:DUF502 domain-containing protein n=1 Tax=Vulcanibacillus modesticaldus TaxID=337097 RepID=A0A1D2YVM9_9BACI|nr:DUF502 domain-containing protein [Vulcanibacillus modesticaldus]OEF99727.1 hypothetical protein BHF71_07475 [Vulcanibacillus modesticaldus]
MLKKDSIRSNLLMGFIVLLPTILTIYVFVFLFEFVDRLLGRFISKILVVLHIIPKFPIELPIIDVTLVDRIPGIGFIATVFLLISVGIATKSLIGKQMIRLNESLFSKIPIARSIYSTVKQITNAFTREKSSFKRVVLVEYPRKGIYTMGFFTGEGQVGIDTLISRELVNVFLPTTPNPTSGWLVLVPRNEVIFLEMSVEDGLKYIISGGVVNPDNISNETDDSKMKKQDQKERELVPF